MGICFRPGIRDRETRPPWGQLDSYSMILLFYQDRYFVMLYGTEPDPSILKEFASIFL
jgi:hypothetical protein